MEPWMELIAAKQGGRNSSDGQNVRVLDAFGMPVEWALTIVVPIFKRKADIMNCSFYRTVKLFEHGMKVVERVLEKGLVE